jgi:hypothetical protein
MSDMDATMSHDAIFTATFQIDFLQGSNNLEVVLLSKCGFKDVMTFGKEFRVFILHRCCLAAGTYGIHSQRTQFEERQDAANAF